MAVPGILPKDKQARDRNAKRPIHPQTTFDRDAVVEAPELPNAEKYGADTLRWYDTWTRTPQASLFLPSDWQRIHMLAPLIELYFKDPQPGFLAEIRQNEARLGATPEDRLRLRMSLNDSERERESAEAESAQGSVSRQNSRRRRDPRLALVGAKTD